MTDTFKQLEIIIRPNKLKLPQQKNKTQLVSESTTMLRLPLGLARLETTLFCSGPLGQDLGQLCAPGLVSFI